MGKAAIAFFQALDTSQYQVVAFTQTIVPDELEEFLGVPVVEPAKLSDIVFDDLFIASAFYDDILREVQELNIKISAKIKMDSSINCITHWSQRDEIVRIKGEKIIGKNTNIFTIGSCFASNLAIHMPSLGLKGSSHMGIRFFHSATILQEFNRLLGGAKKEDFIPYWKTQEGYCHAYWTHPETPYFASKEKCFSWSNKIDEYARENLLKADVVVLTLGLIEVWYNAQTDTYLKSWMPKEVSGNLNIEFKRLTVEQIKEHLRQLRALIQKKLNAQIIITVSPIPLMSTFMPYDVRIANNESKSRIRAAVSEFIEECPDVHYFPAYEIVTGAECKDDFMQKDGRHLHSYSLKFILKNFIETFCHEEIARPEINTKWLTTPLKTASTSNSLDIFSQGESIELVKTLHASGEKFYVLGIDKFAQEFLYNTNVFDLENFSGFIKQSRDCQYSMMHNLPIHAPEFINGKDDLVIVATPEADPDIIEYIKIQDKKIVYIYK